LGVNPPETLPPPQKTPVVSNIIFVKETHTGRSFADRFVMVAWSMSCPSVQVAPSEETAAFKEAHWFTTFIYVSEPVPGGIIAKQLFAGS
jgi:hypothetical protein